MNQIKFSHWYQKIEACFHPNESKLKAQLLVVFRTHHCLLHESFKSYDTWIEKDKHYKLPKTELLVLLFRPWATFENRGLFTTIRRWTPEKEKHYQSKVGEVFQVLVLQEGAKSE